MKHPVDRHLLKVQRSPNAEKKSTTSLQVANAEENRKRPSPEPLNEGSLKRRRHEKPVTEVCLAVLDSYFVVNIVFSGIGR